MALTAVIQRQYVDGKAALWYWGKVINLRNTSVLSESQEYRLEQLLYNKPKDHRDIVIEAYLKAHKEGLEEAVIEADASPYAPIRQLAHRLVNDPHEGMFTVVGVEKVLMSMMPPYLALAVWRYVKEKDLNDFPTKQSATAKWQMHYRLVSRVEGALNT